MGARKLAAGLEGNASLEALSLAWNALGDAGAAALAGMLLQVCGPMHRSHVQTLLSLAHKRSRVAGAALRAGMLWWVERPQ